MSEAVSTAQDTGLQERVNRELAQLILDLRCSEAPEAVLRETNSHIRQAIASLQPWLREGKGWSTVSVADANAGMPFVDDDITSVMPYSPVSGRLNAMAVPMRLWREGSEVSGEAHFSPSYAGPPDSVHGGVIAAVFDELLAMANVVAGVSGFTGTLSIKYHRKTPLDTPIELWSRNVRQDGRKQICHGEMRVDGQVTASAEGLFIRPAGG